MEPNKTLFPDHLPSILHGALVGAGSLWLESMGVYRINYKSPGHLVVVHRQPSEN
jgi:hypothetical protein